MKLAGYKYLSMPLLICFLCLPYSSSADANLIQNPGFESGRNGKADNWNTVSLKTANSVQWISSDVHYGHSAMYISATQPESPGRSVGVFTNPISVPENVQVHLVAWIKAKNIVSGGGWYAGRILMQVFDSSNNTIMHNDLQLDGSILDWTKIRVDRITPGGSKYLTIGFFLTSCTGAMWIDDVELRIVQQAPELSLDEIYNPIIIPSPWKTKIGSGPFSVGNLAIVIDPGIGSQAYLEEEMREFFTQAGSIAFQFFAPGEAGIDTYNTQLVIGDIEATRAIFTQFRNRFSEVSVRDVASQGYFISAIQGSYHNTIYLGGKSEQGRFYGFQTLKQMITTSPAPKIYALDVVDSPTLDRRGIAMGVQWFSNSKEAIERLSKLKGNTVWNEGSFLNYKFSKNWREDFTPDELSTLGNYLYLCKRHFIIPHLSIRPEAVGPSLHPVEFSSNDEISHAARKIKMLYNIGFRHFGLNFDDLQNIGQDILLVNKDKQLFDNNIGKAHSYFIESVYNRIIQSCPDISFSVLPMYYSDNRCITDNQKKYLTAFSLLHPEIKAVACTVTDEGIMQFTKLLERPITIWSNFIASFQSSSFSGEYTWPFQSMVNWDNDSIKSSVEGFVFLPIVPAHEDRSIVSWKTAADFMWAPERYNSFTSFQKAMGQNKGVGDRVFLKAPENIRIIVSSQ